MEFLNFSMLYSMLETHHELLRRYGGSDLASDYIVVKKSHRFEHTATAFGEMLIRLGTWLKEYSCRKAASQEASAPTFIIML